MQIHPYADKFPLITGSGWEEFKESIRTNGLKNPIKVHQGVIVDGRNRYKACTETGITPIFTYLDAALNDDQIRGLIDVENKHRRHMTPGQLAAIGAVLSNAVRGGDRDISNPSIEGMEITVAAAAQTTGSSVASIERAQYVQKNDPEAFERLKDGTFSVNAAVIQARIKEREALDAKKRQDKLDAKEKKRLHQLRLGKRSLLAQKLGSEAIASKQLIEHVCSKCGTRGVTKLDSSYFAVKITKEAVDLAEMQETLSPVDQPQANTNGLSL